MLFKIIVEKSGQTHIKSFQILINLLLLSYSEWKINFIETDYGNELYPGHTI